VRTRLTKQVADAKLFAVQGFCKDMTDVSFCDDRIFLK